MLKIILFVLIFTTGIFCNAQKTSDTLLQESYETLLDLYNNEASPQKSLKYAHAYLTKAKYLKDTNNLLTSYHLKSLLYSKEKRLQYLDSIVYLTKDKEDETYPASTYISQGNFFYDKGDLNKALDYYLKAKTYAEKNYNAQLIFNSNYCIATVRDRTKGSIEALEIHRENYKFVVNNISEFPKTIYLSSLYALSNAYNNVKALDSAKYYNQIGLKEAINSPNKDNLNLFLLNDGTTDYYLKNYGSAINNLNETSFYFRKNNDGVNLTESLYFLGRSYLGINDTIEAIKQFKSIDTIFHKTNNILPKLRESYLLLIDFYKDNQNLNQQLYFLNSLIKLDSVITNNEIYLNKTLIKQYDIPKIIAEKQDLIDKLENKNSKNKTIILGVFLLAIILIWLLYIQHSRKRKYKLRFEEILNNKEISIKKPKKINKEISINEEEKNTINVPKDIVEHILKSLSKFENENAYLDSNIKIQELAKTFKTNANYLSKVINHYKNQNFTTYINFLRIDYVLKELQTNKMYRKFTIKALAREVGFKSSEPFSKTFYKKTGIKPSYFISELEKI